MKNNMNLRILSFLTCFALIWAIVALPVAGKTQPKADNDTNGETPSQVPNAKYMDFFGNGLASYGILTFPTAGGTVTWRILRNNALNQPPAGTSGIINTPWGLTANDLVPNIGDYSGDAACDFNLYRNNSGSPANTYLILPITPNQGPTGNPRFIPWGTSTTDTIGAEGDYDGDGKLDPTVVRTNGAVFDWYVLRSGNNTFLSFRYGSSATDIALPGADYTGDGIADPTVARVDGATNTITWIVGTTTGGVVSYTQWGSFASDFIVPGGDYDGDGRADYMVWRGFGAGTNGTWYLRTSAGATSFVSFGIPGASGTRDRALRGADYDGDGKADISVYRDSNNTFYILRSTGGIGAQQLGVAGNTNIPLASFGTF